MLILLLLKPSFRTHQHDPRDKAAEAAFFNQNQPLHAPFDLAPLQGALPFAPAVGPMHHPNLESSWQNLTPPQREQYVKNLQHEQSFSGNIDPSWAKDYTPSATASQHHLQPSIQHDSPQRRQQFHHSMQGPSSIPFRSDMSMRGMGRLNMTGMRMGQDLHSLSRGQSSSQQMQQQHLKSDDSTQWDTAFTAYDRQGKSIPLLPEAATQKAPARETTQQDADELARTAGKLVSTVEHETNDKFKQSNFLNLMRKIRDKQAGIQGSDIVETSSDDAATTPLLSSTANGKVREGSVSNHFRNAVGREATSQQEAVDWAMREGLLPSVSKGKARLAPGPQDYQSEVEGREMLNKMWAEEDARSSAIERQAMERAFIGDGGDTAQRRREDAEEFARYQRLMRPDFGSAADVINNTSSMEEEFDDLSSNDFVGRRWEGRQGRGVMGVQGAEWDALQKDWDAWQASSNGLKPAMQPPLSAASAPQYQFHAVNPYAGLTQDVYTNPVDAAAALPADMQSVLEREAAVQRDPTNASAWLELGVKQQENEREGLAIAALHKAIQLNPTLREAWLALAVSYTNENDRMSAFEAIERWIEATPEYNAVVKQHRSESKEGSKAGVGFAERHERLSNLLIALARYGSAQDKVDADVQVALGVLFNASEDYDKAVDCFSAALSVRPEDWLLYNRLGATLSNSGRSEEAMRYYHQALDLRPGFVRCHFNLSISCLNLKMYKDAASHIYTALTLQSESAHEEPNDNQMEVGGGITSSSLWETLRVACELMDRPDLATLTKQRDLNAFNPQDFGFGDHLGGEGIESYEEDLFSMPDNVGRRS